MPLPGAEEGIAGLLQRAENRRIIVSPNDSPGTAKREGNVLRLIKSLRPRRIFGRVIVSLYIAAQKPECERVYCLPRNGRELGTGIADNRVYGSSL